MHHVKAHSVHRPLEVKVKRGDPHAIGLARELDTAEEEAGEGAVADGIVIPRCDVIGGIPCPETVACIVGPEGGFAPEEAEAIIKAGIHSVSLGGRILRCETAPDYILTALSYEFEL